jgi:gas vesicle protein
MTYVEGLKGGRVNERTAVTAGALVGALTGAFTAYLFFTDRGREMRDRFEPMVDDVRREFARFQKTLEKVGEMANDGLRVVNEFNAARSQTQYGGDRTSQ